MTTPDTNNATGKLWNPLLNFATLPTAGYFLGSDAIGKLRDYSVFQWIPPASLTPMDFAVGGAINAAALSGIEYFSGRDGADVDFNKALLITLTLAATIFAAPYITKATSEWTGVILTTDQMISIAVFNCAAKATTVAAVAFLKYLRDSSIPAIPTSNDDARKITQHQAAYLYDLFKDDTAKWDELPLSVRIILNMRFKENGSDQQLPLKGFKSKVGEEMQKDELQFLFDQAKGSTSFSETERKHLNSLFYEGGLHSGVGVSKETMPDKVGKDLAGYKATDFATLPESTVRWIHYYLTVFPSKAVEADKRAALCDRMIDLKIPTPQRDFYLKVDHLAPSKKPTPPKDLTKPTEDEKYLFGWFCGYFLKNETEFEALPLNERISWSKAFFKELGFLFPMKLTQGEAKGLDDKQTVYFWKYFNDHARQSDELWVKQPIDVQRVLNENFSDGGHTPRKIYPDTEAAVKNMTEKELRDLNQDLKGSATYVSLLSPEAREAVKARLHKLGIKMAFTDPLKLSLKDRIVENLTVKNVAIGTASLVGIGLACIYGPSLIAAIGTMFKGAETPPDDCTHTLNSGESYTLSEKDVVCFSTDLGVHKLTAGNANDFPNGVLATGTKVDLTANSTLCIGDSCETSLTPVVGDFPYSVEGQTAPLPVTLTDQASLTLDEGGLIQLVHGNANVTLAVGDKLGDRTLKQGDVFSFNEDGNVCVGTGETPCLETFTSDGEAFALYTPPEPTTSDLAIGTKDDTRDSVSDKKVEEEVNQQPVEMEDSASDPVTADPKASTTSDKQVEEPSHETEEVSAD